MDLTAIPQPEDLLEVYFATWSAGEHAPCEHFVGQLRRQFRGATIDNTRPVAEQLARQREDVVVFDGASYDHPWYIVIGRAPAPRRATTDDVLATMRADFGRARWVHPADLRRHVLRRVTTCSDSMLSQLCIQLAEQGAGRVRGDSAQDSSAQDYAFRID
jgi:hypothetical protein